MKIKLKYSLGDKFVDKISGKEYTIDKWKVVKTKEGIVNAYTFHAYCDNLFDYHNVVSFLWVADYTNRYHPVPNYLTARQLNIKFSATF